jgi:hypothetical protein
VRELWRRETKCSLQEDLARRTWQKISSAHDEVHTRGGVIHNHG